jgi:hypothetical protein
MKSVPSIPSIVSGGQTGADRAALDWALERGVACGGWCPKGRKAEDGVIHAKYPLKESSSGSYLQRTEWNVRDSDGTVIFSQASKLTGGSLKTTEFARKHNKPWIHISAVDPDPDGRLRRFLEENVIDKLNIAGPRKSKEPGINEFVIRVLDQAFIVSGCPPRRERTGEIASSDQ